MIVYEAIKEEFLDDVVNDLIADNIHSMFKDKLGRSTSCKEIESWNNSMQYMYKVLQTDTIPNNCGVAIEFNIPLTSKRVDFIISGINEKDNESVVIIELKQWQMAEKVIGKDGIVKTALGKGIRETTHPSYQAWSYAALIEDFNETVQDELIKLYPCAYLHNYVKKQDDPLMDESYNRHIEKAPVYSKGEVIKLRAFISKYLKYGDNKEILYKIECGKLRPSKSLQDSLLKMLKGNQEFVMIDEQKIVYETAISMARKSYEDGKKRVLIVDGGPGTGKSVLGINLLVNLTSQDMVCQYVTKNAAPRNIYAAKLTGEYKKTHINNLFKGSGAFINADSNDFDALIVDEAHRLNKKSGMFKNLGENQIKEIINASKFSIFFIDEHQKVNISDIGNIDSIIDYSKYFKGEFVCMKLESQFRCNGSDGYLEWINDVLQIKNTANFDGFDLDYDIRVFDNPNSLKNLIYKKNKTSNKSRLLAGYCWNWIKEGKNDKKIHDIVIEEQNFSMSWNLGNSETWAIDPDSVQEVGCIHTSQGLEFDYVGVIIGKDMRYEEGVIITDFNRRARTDQSLKGIKKMYKEEPKKALAIADEIIKNTYRTLLTRGQKGCYIYCEDKELGEYISRRIEFIRRRASTANEVEYKSVAEGGEVYE